MATLLIKGVTYHYQVRGTGDPILLLHGFTGRRTRWDTLADTLATDYQVITVDIIGHGDTDSPPTSTRYAMHHVADDIIRLLAYLQINECHVLGYSMGGRLALYTAIHHPEHIRSLILESSSPGLPTESERQARRDSDNAAADKIETQGVGWFVDFLMTFPFWDSLKSLPNNIYDAQHQLRKRNSPVGLANSLRGMGIGAQPSLWDKLSTVYIPVTLITGDLDTNFCTINADMHTRLPNATHHTLPNVGHNTHLENPDAFATLVKAHLLG